jgi:3-deoxy-manno-octulosonate cytidylyltransferase (CMP-KDO synthetase)
VYGYRRNVLAGFYQLPYSPLENSERLEQLRFLEAGYSFLTVETNYRPMAVDIQDDLEKVREVIKGKISK